MDCRSPENQGFNTLYAQCHPTGKRLIRTWHVSCHFTGNKWNPIISTPSTGFRCIRKQLVSAVCAKMSLVSVELHTQAVTAVGSCMISTKCRSRGWGSSLGLGWGVAGRILYVWGQAGGKGWRGMGPLPKDQGLFCLSCARSGLLSLDNCIVEAEEGQRHPNMLLCGVVMLLLRTGFGPCHARRRNMVQGLRPAGPLLLLTPPATAQSNAGTKFLAPRVAAWSLWTALLCIAKSAWFLQPTLHECFPSHLPRFSPSTPWLISWAGYTNPVFLW